MLKANDDIELEKAKAYINAEIIDYCSGSIISKTIIKRNTGSVTLVAFDADSILREKPSPFDRYIQIIEGQAEIMIDGLSYFMVTGQSIILPAHSFDIVKAIERFKMIITTIKSGYE